MHSLHEEEDGNICSWRGQKEAGGGRQRGPNCCLAGELGESR